MLLSVLKTLANTCKHLQTLTNTGNNCIMCKHLQILANTCKTCNCCNHFQTIAISCKLVKSLANIVPQQLTKVHESERPQPDIFHSRTGHTLDLENSRVFKQLKETEKFAERNQMKINHRKTKIIAFNPCRNVETFRPTNF